jgi:hypothetical protein
MLTGLRQWTCLECGLTGMSGLKGWSAHWNSFHWVKDGEQ